MPETLIHRRVAEARDGRNATVITRMPSGWAVLGDQQFLPGYCLLLPDPVVPSLNDVDGERRARFLLDMSLLGDAVLAVTEARRVNYGIYGNHDPALHAHVFARYAWEPEAYRAGPAWRYPRERRLAAPFDPDAHGGLLRALRDALRGVSSTA